MKYLKKFESFESPISKEDLREFFYDIMDEGFRITVEFVSRRIMLNPNTSVERKLNTDDILTIYIFITNTSSDMIDNSKKIKDLFNSEFFEEELKTIDDRLSYYGLYIEDKIIFKYPTHDEIRVFIQKKSDKIKYNL